MSPRPEIAALIERGQVELAEVEHIQPPCTLEEAIDLIPALTNSSFARRLDRCLVNLKLNPDPTDPWWAVYNALLTVKKSINRPISKDYANILATQLAPTLEPIDIPPAGGGYVRLAWLLAGEALRRLSQWPVVPPVQN